MEHSRTAVEREIVKIFGPSSVKGILQLLDQYPPEGERVDESGRARIHLAILKLSEGKIERLRHFVEQACKDYRDVLYWAECF